MRSIKWTYTAVFKQFVERDETNNLNYYMKDEPPITPLSVPCISFLYLFRFYRTFYLWLKSCCTKNSGSVQQNGPRWTDNRKFVSELSGVVRNIRAKITMFDYRESGNSNHRVASVHRKKVEWFVSIWRLNFWSTSSLYIRPSAS